METRAPSTGAASASRVTKTSVFWGLSLTLRPRPVTWTTELRAFTSVLARRERGIGVPSSSAAHTSPVPLAETSGARSRPKDWVLSAEGRRRRVVPGPSGARAKYFSCSLRTVGMRSSSFSGMSHCVSDCRLRA